MTRRWRPDTRVGLLVRVALTVLVAIAAGLVWSWFFGGFRWWLWASLWLLMLLADDLRTARRRRRGGRTDRPGHPDGRPDEGRGRGEGGVAGRPGA